MQKTKTSKWRNYLKWTGRVLLVQLVLVNISAAIYAYKFTHFYDARPQLNTQNVFDKTWKLFVGPTFYKNTEEPAPAFPYKTVLLKTTDGLLIDAWYSTVDAPKGCIIFFHGITANKSFLENEAAVARQWGYNVLLVDFRAHGKSGGRNSSFGMKETDEVAQAFQFAKTNGNSRIILYGVSLGAGVCIKAVAEGKAQPAAIVADMPFSTLHNHLKSRAKVLGFPTEPFAAFVTMWIGLERGYNGFSHNIASYAKLVSCPVLVQWGAKDQFVMRKEVEAVYQNLPSAGKQLVVYPDADHESFLHIDPLTWQRQVGSFLEKVEKGN